jgi:hypothetical protein
MTSLGRPYGEDIVYNDNPYTLTSTYHDGQLKIYIMHPTRSMSTQRDSLLLYSSRCTPGYPTNETGARRAGYIQNNASKPLRTGNTSREAPGQNLGIPLSVDPMDAKSHVASLFSDSNELVT